LKAFLAKPTLKDAHPGNLQGFRLMTPKKTIIFTTLLATLTLAWFWLPRGSEEAKATWWNDSWNYRKTLTINSNKVSADLTNFPVLVSLTDTDLSTHAQADGDDFVFTLRDGTVLKHEIESYASSTGTLVAWAKMPTLSSSQDTDVFMYYGNAGVASQEDAENVWDESFVLVQHLEEEGTGTRYDSTKFNNDASLAGYYEDNEATSNAKIGRAHWNQMNEGILIPDSSSISGLRAATLSGWINADNFGLNYPMLFGKSNFNDNREHRIRFETTAENISHHISNDGEDPATFENSIDYDGVIATGTWHYVVGTFDTDDSNTLNLYIDGQHVDTDTGEAGPIYNATSSFSIGSYGDVTTGYEFEGLIDEVRYANVARSADWIETEYNNQNDPASFFSHSSEETGPGPIGYWSFDEGYGTTANDSSGQGNDGTITGAAWQEESMCVSGKCLYFDGTDDYVKAEFDHSSGAVTASAWVRPTGTGEARIVEDRGKGNDSYPGWQLKINNDNGKWGIYDTILVDEDTDWVGGYAGAFAGSRRFSYNEWHFVTMVFDDSLDDMFIYVDGDLAHTYYENNIDTYGNNLELHIGATTYSSGAPDSADQVFEGYLDEVKIYPYVRTADQIKQDYNAGLAGISSNSGVSAAFGSQSDSWLSDGLVGYWKMDESATTSGAIDSSGNGNDGTYYGNASTTAGKFGNGGVFDGTGDLVNCGNDSSFDITSAITISAWINVSSTVDKQRIVDKVRTDAYTLRLYDNGSVAVMELAAEYGGVTQTPGYSSFDNFIILGQWTHVSATYNGDIIRYYIDGQPAGTVKPSPAGDIGTNANDLVIGARLDGSYEFRGQIDEVRIYNRALSPDEVQKLYEWAPGPISYYKMDERSGTVAYDSSGNENNGTYQNSPESILGKINQAYSFNSSSKRISIDSPSGSSGGNTISLWYKRSEDDSSTSWRALAADKSSNIHHFISNSTTRNLGIWDGSFRDFSYNPPDDGKWHHYEVVYQSGENATLYVDGVYQNQISTSLDFSTYPIGSIGNWNSGNYYAGHIDEVKIYNYARTQKQILQDMAGAKGTEFPIGNSVPVLHLSFDEGYGATAHDSSIHKNNGSLQPGDSGDNTASSSMWTKNGKFGGAMEFDGTDDYINIGDNAELTFNNGTNDLPFSVSYWSKHSAVVGDACIVAKYLDSTPFNGEWSAGYNSNNHYFQCLDDSALVRITITGSTLPALDTWYHVLWTYDGSGSETGLSLYVNGVLDANATKSEQGSYSKMTDESADVEVGTCLQDFGSYYFDGKIDEVKIYNYALTPSEIKTLYNDTKGTVMGSIGGSGSATSATSSNAASLAYCIPGSTDPCTPPVLEYKLDEKTGLTAYDSSGNGNDGTVSGASWGRGKFGSALSFSQSGDYVDTGVSTNYAAGDFTVEAWINLNTLTSGGSRIVADDENNNGWALSYADGSVSERIRFYVRGMSTDSLDADNVITSANKWFHVVGVFDNSGDERHIYVNGELKSSDLSDGGFPTSDAGNLSFGGLSSTGYVRGLVDNVMIYDYVRSPAQIAWDYNRGGPVLQYRFDECQGGTIHDESGNVINGQLYLGTSDITATGTCASSSSTFWGAGESGRINSSASFDGVDDYVRIPNDYTILRHTGNITVSAWIKLASDFSSGGFIFSRQGDDGADTEWGVRAWVDADKRATFGVVHTDGGAHGHTLKDTKALNTDQWYHYTGVWDGSYLYVYLDGQVVNSENIGSGTLRTGTDVSSSVGAANVDSSRIAEFNGQIDELKIWNYALTQEQIKTEYNGGAVRFGD
jgi:hypothetical protein